MDTYYQRAKIVVEETRRFYFQIIFTLGIFIVVAIRANFISRSLFSMNSISFMGENISSTPTEFSFISSPTFIILYMAVIFLLILGFRYLILYNLKRNFRKNDGGIKKLKKYMKTDEIPTNEEVDAKFHEDKNKSKRKFYFLVARVIIFIAILYYIYSNIFNNFFLFELVVAFSVLSLIYRYLIIFHADSKFFDKEWENKKIKEFISEFKG
ncbi:2TM domain-containing protein [Methanobrevibacter sp. TMH8]|uniref:2TM domain-containing protein n=1 Tax=Methanobrevibacter sp. TMH8 TaxID=2848611 RepID=UPI001CC95F19|nr:2TM domain-containing protein [Methanobrevibacter sp. TMH8]